jgi:hypothetical protein
MLKYIIYTISLILTLMATLIFTLCVILLEAVVFIAAKSVNLFKAKKYGKHRVSQGLDDCL